MKFKTIKKHIIVITLILVMLPLLIISVYTTISSYTSSVTTVENNLMEVAEVAAGRVEWELQAFVNVSYQAGCDPELADANTSAARKEEKISLMAQHFNMSRGNLIGADGIGVIDGNDYSQREYYIEAMKGNTCVSEPLVSKVTGQLTVIVAAPLWEGGIADTKPVGCVYFVPDEEFLNDIMRELHISENGDAYMLDKDGNTIADVDSEVAKSGQNIAALALEDSGYAEQAEINAKMVAGEIGFGEFSSAKGKMLMGYAPVGGTDGWSVGVYAPSKDFLYGTYLGILVSIILFVVAAITAVLCSILMGNNIGNPVKLCTDRIKLLGEGDLKSEVPVVNTTDETKVLADTTASLVQNMNSIINDIGYMLSNMANGNFDVKSQCDASVYKGDFHVLIESVQEINRKLSSTLHQINTSADQVSTGSDQVSGGAQTLSQGATEQASSVQELAATIHTISDRVVDTAANCEHGNRLMEETVAYVDTAAQDMEKLTEAMKDISEASNEISNIIKAIEDIAFQTNILALNAAVEAARAGDAGKGFAVVADEVRNLASKSADAAHDTTVLIERAIAAVENGTAITAETAEAVKGVDEKADEVKRIVAQIARASAEQSDMINQVTVGVEQISGVVQNNSATAEESAAASEELSGQALMLKKLVSSFKLRK